MDMIKTIKQYRDSVVTLIDYLLDNNKWSELEKIIASNGNLAQTDTSFAYFKLIYDVEKSIWGENLIYGAINTLHEFNSVVKAVKALKNIIVRADWTEDYIAKDILDFAAKSGFQEIEVLYLSKYWVRNRNSIYNRVKSNIKTNIYKSKTYNDTCFAFIMCINNDEELEEAKWYIDRLLVPDGCRVELLEIRDAKSMCDGYNEGMEYANQLNAKYKIYMHQDIRILNQNLLFELLEIFEDDSIGMVGMVGPKEMPSDGVMWDLPQFGNIAECRIDSILLYQDDNILKRYDGSNAIEAAVVDGCFIATQYDIPWRSDIFDGWHFYDASQGMEFRKHGYRIVIPYMESPWVYHDPGIPDMGKYEHYQRVFCNEYFKNIQER